MVPKVFEPLKFYCSMEFRKSIYYIYFRTSICFEVNDVSKKEYYGGKQRVLMETEIRISNLFYERLSFDFTLHSLYFIVT